MSGLRADILTRGSFVTKIAIVCTQEIEWNCAAGTNNLSAILMNKV